MKDWSRGKHSDLAVVKTKEGFRVARVKRGKMSQGKYLDVTVTQFSSMLPSRRLEDALQDLEAANQSRFGLGAILLG